MTVAGDLAARVLALTAADLPLRAVDVFVRDRGPGFDLDAVPEDRHGVRGSILDRMTRHGGTAEVRSSAGEGTEVRLHLSRLHSPADSNQETP